jgi:putative heme-binding domain-containing protein
MYCVMRLLGITGTLVVVSLTLPQALADNVQHGLRVPAGFEVTEYAGSDLANDIYCMTLDPRGRVVVSGRGYIRALLDEKNTGKANRAVEIAAALRDGAMGLLWEGEWLYFTGEGGLRRYRIPKGKDKPAGPSELIRAMKTSGEHDAHALARGPDGWLYVLCGNMAKINRSYAQLPTSPIKKPIAGCLLRFTPDLKKSEIVADGFRNAYGMDFNIDGELFTFDSDNERCISLPWYESIRFYHVMEGRHYGWQAPQKADWWRLPPYFADVVAPVETFGRGSPTGVACYRHAQFPKRYRGGFFLLDWTFGRVYFVSLRRSGSTYTCNKEIFLQSVGDNGFAPTALVVHPTTGDLFISIGGRGTRGAVYRIHYAAANKPISQSALEKFTIKPRSLTWKRTLSGASLKKATTGKPHARRRALEGLLRHRNHFKTKTIQQAVRANWDDADRYIRKAAADLIPTLSERARQTLLRQAKAPAQQLTLAYGSLPDNDPALLDKVSQMLAMKTTRLADRLAAVRYIQLALGDVMSARVKGTVWEGYTPRRRNFWSKTDGNSLPPAGNRTPGHISTPVFTRLLAALRTSFPSGNADLDRELARTLAVVEDDDPETLGKISRQITPASDPIDDVHYLIVLARLRGPRSAPVTAETAAALLALDGKLVKRRASRDRHWPLRVAELYAELVHKDSRLNRAILEHANFGQPDHVLFAQALGFDRKRAALAFLDRAKKVKDFEWTPALVELISTLPAAQVRPLLRQLWTRGGLEESILKVLARKPESADRDKFLEGLNSPQLATVRSCLGALERLPRQKAPATILALIQSLRRLPEGKAEKVLADSLAGYLHKLTGQEKLGTDKDRWASWFRTAYPRLADRLGNEEGVDVAGWDKRLAGLDWSQGDAGRGQPIFIKANCASCHSGAQALGPDLRGVAGRFSRADLFTAILLPSKDVSPRYRTTQITTADGKVYQGMIVYEAVGSVLLQTGPATTIRIVNKQIAERRTTAQSLMPAGLIDKLTDREIADLYAYLKSLGNAPQKKRGKRG